MRLFLILPVLTNLGKLKLVVAVQQDMGQGGGAQGMCVSWPASDGIGVELMDVVQSWEIRTPPSHQTKGCIS